MCDARPCRHACLYLVSLVSAWELAIKAGLGKLTLALFDRLLVAQALVEKLPIVTADPIFRKYGVKRIW